MSTVLLNYDTCTCVILTGQILQTANDSEKLNDSAASLLLTLQQEVLRTSGLWRVVTQDKRRSLVRVDQRMCPIPNRVAGTDLTDKPTSK